MPYDEEAVEEGRNPWGPFVHPAVLLPSAVYPPTPLNDDDDRDEFDAATVADEERRLFGELSDGGDYFRPARNRAGAGGRGERGAPVPAAAEEEAVPLRSFFLSLKRKLREYEDSRQQQQQLRQRQQQQQRRRQQQQQRRWRQAEKTESGGGGGVFPERVKGVRKEVDLGGGSDRDRIRGPNRGGPSRAKTLPTPFACRSCANGIFKNATSKRQGRDDHGWLIAYG